MRGLIVRSVLRGWIIMVIGSSTLSLRAEEAFPVQVRSLESLADDEVAVSAEVELPFSAPESALAACAPAESSPFPTQMSLEASRVLFTEKEVHDLMKCRVGDCAFNFTPSEIQNLQSLQTPDERKTQFFRFYQDRVAGRLGVDPRMSSAFIRSRDNAFEDCAGHVDYEKLLNQRPSKSLSWRLSAVDIQTRGIRPTARLSQSAAWKTSEGVVCVGDALVFSDHYDIDRVQIWSLRKGEGSDRLRVQLRHRIDLLNTTFRRLFYGNKTREMTAKMLSKQATEVASCLQAKASADKTKSTPLKKSK